MEAGNGLTVDHLLAIRSVGVAEPPHWSRNGNRVVFVSSIGGSPELWSTPYDGGPLSRLSVGLGGVGHLATFMPTRSPVSDQVAYVSAKTGADEIWLWSPDGSTD